MNNQSESYTDSNTGGGGMFGGAGTGTVTGTESKNTESYTGPRGSGQEQSSFAK